MDTEEECFSGDEIDQFNCPKHLLIYTNYCTTTQQLLCQECLIKCSLKVQNIISIEKALNNISLQNKQQLQKVQKIIKNYNNLDDQIQKENAQIHKMSQVQIQSLNSVCSQIMEIVQMKFQELIEQVEVHKMKHQQILQDSKCIIDEYKGRGIQLEKNIVNQQNTSGYEQLKKFREYYTINCKTIKELENEYESLSQAPKIQYQQLQIRNASDIVKQISNILCTLERDSDYRIKRVSSKLFQQPNTTRASPFAKKGFTQHSSPHFSLQSSKQQMRKTEVKQITLDIPTDLSSILDKASPEQSIINDFFSNKQSLSEHSISQMEIPIQNQTQFYIIGGLLKGQRQNLIELVDIQSKQSAQHDFLVSNRYGFQIAYHGNQILLIGGKQEGIRTALCESYDPNLKQSKISQLILTKGVSGLASKQIGNKLYISGGKTDQGIQDIFQLINLDTYQTKNLQSVPIKCYNHTLVQGNEPNSMYLFDEQGCFKYDMAINQWKKIKSPSYPRRSHISLTLPDGIWIFGGRSGKKFIKQIEKYDETDQQFYQMGELICPIVKSDAIVSDDYQFVYLVGGKTQENIPSSNIWRYSILTNQCVLYSQFTKPRYSHKLIPKKV
ncbi:unnamed protein product [Paramecium octaurelia]|uniref:Kelch motif family protein n=1 Tax=Paramecium octaurelia TaxID=43137 RepID=A0A8S1U744_PAROT|nr:unnamed protein product [Paramecium octaurelia]